MGDSFYHIFAIPYLFLLTLFFGRCGVRIHNVITKFYHMSVITSISRKICDKKIYKYTSPLTKLLVVEVPALVLPSSMEVLLQPLLPVKVVLLPQFIVLQDLVGTSYF
jgi:hypothetical protein